MPPPPKSNNRPPASEKQRLQSLLDGHPPRETVRSEVQLAVGNGNVNTLRGFAARDQERLLEVIDKAAPSALIKDTKFVTILGDISSDILMLPRSVGSLQGLEKSGEIAVGSGGNTDVWRGIWNDKPVAFKAFRVYPPQSLLEAKKILWRQAPIWKRLSHENVLPFHGVDTSIFQLALVYEWGKNGNIIQYLESNRNALRPKLLLQVARGLQYLHSLDVVHGDLKGANVIISASGNARVGDYGLSLMTSNPSFTAAATPGVVGLSRWIAPEIIDPSGKGNSKSLTASKPADVFAFAMLAVEVFTGKVPFGDIKNETAIVSIVNGKRPTKPLVAEELGLTADMWKFIGKCWEQNPNKRPNINEVVSTWEGFVVSRSQFADPSLIYNEKDGDLKNKKPKKCLCGVF